MTEKIKRFNFKELFFALTFILACFTTNSDKLSGYWGSEGNIIIISRYILIFLFVSFATILNKGNGKFTSKFILIAPIIISAICIFDYYVTQLSGSQFLFRVWWIGAIFVTEASVFIIETIKPRKYYKKFFKAFWIGFAPIYLFLFFLCFIRTPFSSEMTTNFTLGQGTFLMLKAFINDINVSFEAPLIFFGNLLVFVPIPFILYSIFNIKKNHIIAIIGISLPFIIEGYQYLFRCGNVDIDDIFLNVLGFLIGLILFIIIKVICQTKCNT